jgi:hypothetical protein
MIFGNPLMFAQKNIKISPISGKILFDNSLITVTVNGYMGGSATSAANTDDSFLGSEVFYTDGATQNTILGFDLKSPQNITAVGLYVHTFNSRSDNWQILYSTNGVNWNSGQTFNIPANFNSGAFGWYTLIWTSVGSYRHWGLKYIDAYKGNGPAYSRVVWGY